jgi:hypothetical protein
MADYSLAYHRAIGTARTINDPEHRACIDAAGVVVTAARKAQREAYRAWQAEPAPKPGEEWGGALERYRAANLAENAAMAAYIAAVSGAAKKSPILANPNPV